MPNRSRTLIFLLAFLVILFFAGLTKTFYQQDEWYGLGDILVYGKGAIIHGVSLLEMLVGKGRVIAIALVYFLLGGSRFNVVALAIFATAMHTLNSILIYLLARKFTNDHLASFAAAFFFAFNAVSQGAVTWVASAAGTLPAATLIILSVFCYFKFLENIHPQGWKVLTFVLLYLSLFFKETGIFLFILYPLYYLFLRKPSLKDFLQKFWLFLIFALISAGSRMLEFKLIPVEKDLFLTGSSRDYFLTLALRALIYPLTAFSQILIPPQMAFEAAKRVTWNHYQFFPPELYDLVAQSLVLDMIFVFLSGLIFFFLFLLFRNASLELRRRVSFWFLFGLFSFFPYVIIAKTGSYLEGRYYYLAAISSGMVIGFIVLRLFEMNYQKAKNLLILGFIVLMSLHIKTIREEIERQRSLAKERLSILAQISETKKQIKNKQVFYLTGDRNFYITQGNPVPMQQGMGYTLLVWYYGQNKAPKNALPLIQKHFLWEMDGQGYQEVDGFGYGYFWDTKEVKNLLKEGKINKEDIAGIYYDSKRKQISDITQEVVAGILE